MGARVDGGLARRNPEPAPTFPSRPRLKLWLRLRETACSHGSQDARRDDFAEED